LPYIKRIAEFDFPSQPSIDRRIKDKRRAGTAKEVLAMT
jgi:hypothetical protein